MGWIFARMIEWVGHPIRGVFGMFAFVGFAAHLSLAWGLVFLFGSVGPSMLIGCGRLALGLRAVRRFEASPFATGYFTLTKLDPPAAYRTPFKVPTYLFVGTPNESTPAGLRHTLEAQCYLIPDEFAAIVIRKPFADFKPQDLFEFLHELGHAGPEADLVETAVYVDLLLCAFDAWAFLVVIGYSKWSLILATAFLLVRTIHWWKWRRSGIEAERCADAFAMRQMERADLAAGCVEPFVRYWRSRLKREIKARRVPEIRMLLTRIMFAESNIETLRRGEQVDPRPWTMGFFSLLLGVAIGCGPLFGNGSPTPLLWATCGLTAVTLLLYLLLDRVTNRAVVRANKILFPYLIIAHIKHRESHGEDNL